MINLQRIQFILSNGKRWKDIDFIDSAGAQRCDNLDDIDATSFDLEFLNVFDKDNITKISSRYTNKAWASHYAIITKDPRLEIGLREQQVNHQTRRRTKRGQEGQVSEWKI